MSLLRRKGDRRREKTPPPIPTNLFYVASPSVVEGGSHSEWKKSTVDEAVAHGVELLRKGEQDIVYVVEIVRVLRFAEPAVPGLHENEPPIEVLIP